MNPTRTSIWDAERFRAHTSPWGAFARRSRATLVEREARVLVTPAANYLAIATRWVQRAAGLLPRARASPRRSSSRLPTSTSSPRSRA